MSKKILNIQNLSIKLSNSQGTRNLINDISFSLEGGKTLGIVGESGSGKSLTSLSIMRFLPENSAWSVNGKIFFTTKNNQEVDLLSLSEKEMQRIRGNEIAMIFQDPMTSLNPSQRCGEQVVETLRLHQNVSYKEAKKRVIELFTEAQLPRPEAMFKAYPHEISGGQKQRVMIAIAMACNPALLIADEPTTALDATVQMAILDLMKQFGKKYGTGIIFISHDLNVIAKMSDHIAVMYKGELLEYNSTEELLKNPQHQYTKGLLACRPTTGKRLRELPTVNDFLNGGTNKEEVISTEERLLHHQKMYAQTPVLEVRNLNVEYALKKNFFGKTTKKLQAVDGANLEIYPGETLGLVGESGSGKTTIGRTILQLVKAQSGNILYKGVDLTKLSPQEMRAFRNKLQIVFQDPYSSLNPRYTIGRAILEPIRLYKIRESEKECREEAFAMLEKVGLDASFFDRYPHELSGGQRQRACIARTLSLRPEFVICDESVSALDVSVQAQILNLLNKLKKEMNFTCIFISHDLSVVKYMSDRIVVMKNGAIIEVGEADELYKNPKNPYTGMLIQAV